jgi:surfactin synthase thioesterase subunit
VQLPGRENRMREPSWESYESLAEQLIEGLGRFFDRPFGFFGHCGSVFIGVETALVLERRGLPVPAHLFVSSAMPPHEAHEAQVLSIPEEELGDIVLSLMRARGLEPSAEIVELSLEPMKADVRAHRRYRRHDRPRLPCPVTAIGWTDDDTLPASILPGWLEYGTVEVVVLEGTHWSFLDAPPALQERIARGFEADHVGAAA